jgi:Ca-activated chloride channel family protein
MASTLRRPSVPGVALNSRFPTGLIELPYPSRLETIDALLTTYLDQIRQPASAIFVLDLSGSMQGDRLDSLKQALTQLTGLDTSLTGRFARFRAREQITFVTFSTTVLDVRDFTIDDTNPSGTDMSAIRDYVNGLETHDSTAIYTAEERAYDAVKTKIGADPNRLYSVVLMTDGENNSGPDAAGFSTYYRGLPTTVQAVKTYPILFGEGNVTEMQALADLTGGKTFDAKSASLQTIFKQIRGYQ